MQLAQSGAPRCWRGGRLLLGCGIVERWAFSDDTAAIAAFFA